MKFSTTAMDDETLEREANYFAMCLLMPRKLLIQEVEKMGGISLVDDDEIKTLAKMFKVSIPAMALRLGEIYSKQ